MNSNNQSFPLIVLAAGTGSRWRRIFHPGSWVNRGGEALIPEYANKMDVLRNADDEIANWINDLDGLVTSAKKALDQSRLMDVAIYLGRINKRFKSIQEAGKNVEEVQKQSLKEFDTESKELSSEDAILEVNDGQNKVAFLGDWYQDWKRRFFSDRLLDDKFRLERNRAIKAIIVKATQIVAQVKNLSKQLGHARDLGKIGMYISILKKISNLQIQFYKEYKPVYNEYLKEMVEEVINQPNKNTSSEEHFSNELGAEIPNPEKNKKISDLGALEIPAEAEVEEKPLEPAPPPPPPPPAPARVRSKRRPPSTPAQTNPAPAETETETEKNKTSQLFISELKKASELNDKIAMQGMLLAYAESIENTDPETGLKLIAIAESLNDE